MHEQDNKVLKDMFGEEREEGKYYLMIRGSCLRTILKHKIGKSVFTKLCEVGLMIKMTI